MGLAHYLAMTAAELRHQPSPLHPIVWMACHFSPYGKGLSNLPQSLTPGSLLAVDDITPIHGHDPQYIGQQLLSCVEALGCRGVILDFQRPGYEAVEALARHLTRALPCPVAVTPEYARGLDCPVFLPPVPCWDSLTSHLALWQGREIWLETSTDGQQVTLRETGPEDIPLPRFPADAEGFSEDVLHCHYRVQEEKNAAVFTLWRTAEDQNDLLREAESKGIPIAVGLYQESILSS